ncbi:MAG TPA: hypothetical protein VN327_13670 [Pseudonocardiaceae bacterium]|jgi:hypothetical protein|nr:hypothetical protein [Pseudonocardiaceae bacterium]
MKRQARRETRVQQRLTESYLEVLRIVEHQGQWVQDTITKLEIRSSEAETTGPEYELPLDDLKNLLEALRPKELAARQALADAVADELGRAALHVGTGLRVGGGPGPPPCRPRRQTSARPFPSAPEPPHRVHGVLLGSLGSAALLLTSLAAVR